MTNPTWRGIEIDPALLENYGWYVDTITVDGVSYKRLIGYQVAGLSEMAQYMSAAGGAIPSLRYNWSTTTTDADPGAGYVRPNNATISSVTYLYASKTDDGGATVTSILNLIDDSTSTVKARLRIAHRTDPTKWATFTVSSAVVDASGYVKIPVAYVAGSGTFSLDDDIAIGFVATGDIGSVGPSGNNKVCEGGVAGGTANAPTLTSSPAFGGTRGEVVVFTTGASANTAAVTATVNGVSQALRKNGSALVAGDLAATTTYAFVSDGTYLHMFGSTAAGGGSGGGSLPSDLTTQYYSLTSSKTSALTAVGSGNQTLVYGFEIPNTHSSSSVLVDLFLWDNSAGVEVQLLQDFPIGVGDTLVLGSVEPLFVLDQSDEIRLNIGSTGSAEASFFVKTRTAASDYTMGAKVLTTSLVSQLPAIASGTARVVSCLVGNYLSTGASANANAYAYNGSANKAQFVNSPIGAYSLFQTVADGLGPTLPTGGEWRMSASASSSLAAVTVAKLGS